MISVNQAKVAFDAYRRKAARQMTSEEERLAESTWLTCVAFVKLTEAVGFEDALDALKGGVHV